MHDLIKVLICDLYGPSIHVKLKDSALTIDMKASKKFKEFRVEWEGKSKNEFKDGASKEI